MKLAINQEVVCSVFFTCVGNSNDASSHRCNFTCIERGNSVLFCWGHVTV